MYQVFISIFGWMFPLLRAAFPNHVTTTELVGKAMLETVRRVPQKRVVEAREINALGGAA